MDYPFPPSVVHGGPVRWTGKGFTTEDGRAIGVACYDQAASNWSDELTRLHEAEAGERHPIDVASRALAVRSIRRWVRGDAPVILDVGCSSGHLLTELTAAFPRATVIGADYIPELLERLAARLPNVPIVQFDLRKCPLPDASIDAVTCLNVLEHIDDDEQALREVHRILKPGGIAHVEVPAGPHLYDVYDELLMHHRRYRMRGLLELARRTGFEPLRGTHLGALIYPAFAMVKRKNRAKLSLGPEEKKALVAGQIRSTGHSAALAAVIRLETALGSFVRYPLGIRCVVVLRREA